MTPSARPSRTRLGCSPESAPAFLALVIAPTRFVALGVATVSIAPGPGQAVKRGWRSRRDEDLLVVRWLVPYLGPGCYLLDGGRRFIAVRFLREKLAGGAFAASDDLADAGTAFEAYRTADAARSFAAAGRLLQSLRDDAHFRHPTVGARLDARRPPVHRS